MTNENDTIEKVCEDMESSIIIDESGSYFFTERIRKIYKREIEAKDAEIAAFQSMISIDNAVIAKERKVIKELADKLADILACDGVRFNGADCYKNCPKESREMCGRGRTCQLVAKAREVLAVSAETQDKEEGKK